ncbi:MAG: ABC transporter ATP-binding protein [Bacilli bacterium]|nr:ABC transporter ATP-binding protein [Bacilli bacterium]
MKLYKEVLKKYKKFIIFYVLIGIIANFLNVFEVDLFQRIIDSFDGDLSITLIIIFGIVMLVNLVVGYIENYPEQQLQKGLPLSFKLQALKKMKTIDYLEYQKLGTGLITERVNEGSEAASNNLINFHFKLVRYLLPTALFSLLYIAIIDLKLLLFVALGYVLVMIVTKILLKKLYSVKEKVLTNQEMLNKHLLRGFMELVIFRTNKKYDSEIKITEKGIKNIVDGKTRIKMIHEIFFTAFGILVGILKVIMLLYAFYSKSLTIGEIVAIITLLGKAYEPIAIFNVEYIDYKLNKQAVDKFIKLLDLKDVSNIDSGLKLKKLDGNIELKNIDYSYENKKVLNNVSLKIKSGSYVAFVGTTGSGKSTLIKLISGLIKTKKGEVLVDGTNLNEIDLNSYYDHVSYLSQDSVIFDGTLKENIVFDKKVSDEEIEKVLGLVCLEEFYKKLPDGLDTNLGEKGILVSGGERQRIGLARLFFDKANVVILDEATSQVDNITEKVVMKNINNYLENKTLIVIAHRLNTIENADEIFVVLNGKVIDSGKYDDLKRNNEYFEELTRKRE